MAAFEGRIGSGELEEFHGDWSDFYSIALQRVLAQHIPEKGKALAALNWICYAARPLSVEELSQAVAGFEETDAMDGPTLEAICAGLIIVDPSGTARLFHYTAHEFLERENVVGSQRSHLSLAQKCLNVLQKHFRPDEVEGTGYIPPRRPAYLRYAAENWGYHLRRAQNEPAAWANAMKFLKDKSVITKTTECMENIPDHLKTNITALHLSTFFGSRALVLYCIDHLHIPINAETRTAHAATQWALIFKKPRMLEVLLKRGANINTQDSKGRSLLHLAISNEDVPSTEVLLQNHHYGLDADLRDEKGYTPLHLATKENHLWAVRLLVRHSARHGGDLGVEDDDGFSALQLAFWKGHKQIIQILVEGGADMNKPTKKDGFLILNRAASNGKDELVHFLISNGAELDKPDRSGLTAIQLSVLQGHTGTAHTLLKAGADRNKKDQRGNTLLHSFIENWSNIKDKSLFWILIECGCPLEQKNAHGMTPLQLAVVRENMSAVWLLVNKGANLGAKNRQGLTPLHIAVVSNRLSIVHSLLDQGADCEALDNEGHSPMHAAAAQGYIAVMAAFLCRGKGIHITNKSGLTPLHTAAKTNQFQAASFLLQYGADPDIADKSGRTPLYLAIVENCQKTAAILLKAIRRPYTTDHEKQSYLHVAAFSGECELAETLISNGILIDQQDARGRTPLHAAIVAHKPDVVSLLVRKGANVNLVDADGYDALQHADVLGDEELIRALTKPGDN